MFLVLLTSLINTSSIVNASNHTKYVSSSNQKCKMQSTFINLHPNVSSQELHFYQFAVKLGRCVGSCNTPNDLSNKVSALEETEDSNIHVFNMITDINE